MNRRPGSLRDLSMKIMEILVADKTTWYPFSEFLPLGEGITPEYASQIFTHSYPRTPEDRAKRPLGEQIAMGRKRAVYTCLRRLVVSGKISSTSEKDPGKRNYRISESFVQKPRKIRTAKTPPVPKATRQPKPDKRPVKKQQPSSDADAIIGMLRDINVVFRGVFKRREDRRNFDAACRSARLAILTSSPLPLSRPTKIEPPSEPSSGPSETETAPSSAVPAVASTVDVGDE